MLIDEGADIDVPGEFDCAPFHEAALQGHVAVVQLLLARGADPLRRCEFGDFYDIARRSTCEALLAIVGGEPGASPNGGPTTRLGNSRATEEPPSVS